LRNALNFEQIGQLRVAHPGWDEQRAIARFLDRETARIDALVVKKERLIELLQEQRTAIITHAVTKGLPSTGVSDYRIVTERSKIPYLYSSPGTGINGACPIVSTVPR